VLAFPLDASQYGQTRWRDAELGFPLLFIIRFSPLAVDFIVVSQAVLGSSRGEITQKDYKQQGTVLSELEPHDGSLNPLAV
jgi:hypothetical protein